MDVLISLIWGIFSQCMHILNHHIVHVKYTKFCKFYLIEAGKKKIVCISSNSKLNGAMLVAWNQPKQGHFLHQNHQMLQIRAFISGSQLSKLYQNTGAYAGQECKFGLTQTNYDI